ncbi:FMN-binding negative transcriptional regulator [Sediminibacterium soli]|uniref:FMN-binding negative transcriptional regulator n=1 Tax=Sediminibacterium soli TaxID=2698829 RepID=UPI00137B8AAA|nr:FMN-binding negative transcriptional regulator [Sediminibacterium soli]NCI47129.1 FMN-binding negative transcriptional regulator [Sediminibacterium soli]
MYNLPYFKEKDAAVVLRFMKEHPFVLLTGVDDRQRPVATQVPVLLQERDGVLYLRGHIMRNNDHHRAFEQNKQVLAIFSGPHTYVSASWYENKQQGSTWNYMSVHAHGEMCFLPETDLRQLLDDLTAHFENDPGSPALYRHIPEAYISSMLKAILAFEIKLASVEHVFKLSQNRDEKSFDNIIEKLNAGNADAQYIAAEMRKRKQALFPL